jgi:hypothetical protein
MNRTTLVSALAVVTAMGVGIAATAQDTAPSAPPPPGSQMPMGEGINGPGPQGDGMGMGRQEGRGRMGDDDQGRWGRGGGMGPHGMSHHGMGPHRMGPGGMGPGGMGPGADMGSLIWQLLDPEGTGSVTSEQVTAALKSRFAEADTDGDGKLSADEIVAEIEKLRDEVRMAFEKKMVEGFIDRHDVDHTGLLTFDQMFPGDATGRIMDRFDRNDDGTITKDEVQRPPMMGGHGPQMQKRHDRNGDRRGH